MRPRSPGIPVPRPEIRGRGGAGERKLAAGDFEVCPYFPPKFGDGAGTEFLSPSGTRTGRGWISNPRKSPKPKVSSEESYKIFFSIFGSRNGTRFELFDIFFYNLLSDFSIFVENMSIIEKIGNSALVKSVV